jgi:hypothetical protein
MWAPHVIFFLNLQSSRGSPWAADHDRRRRRRLLVFLSVVGLWSISSTAASMEEKE